MTDLPASPRAHQAVGPWFLLLLALAVAGCAATPQSRALLEAPPADLPARVELEQVPFFAQSRYQCGPAALAMVLRHTGGDATPDELVGEVYVPERRGTLRTEMRAAARARGLVAYPLQPRLHALLSEIAAGRPVLVMQNLGLDWLPRWHFAVVVGYDLDRGAIILRSGRERRRITPLRTFERTWARAERWAQVIVPPGEPPATAEPVRWLTAARELEQTGATRPALVGYRAATERWPGSLEAWLVRGNGAYASGTFEEARRSFRRAVELAPGQATGWNNLAYALARSGCADAARASARCAIELAPDDPGPRDTLDEIETLVGPGDVGQCAIPACPVAGGGTTK